MILLSDHGEGLGDHGEQEHSVFLYREDIRVPLFVKLPGSRMAGKTVQTPVALTDVFPTVVSLLGLPVPAGVEGVKEAVRGVPRRGLGYGMLRYLGVGGDGLRVDGDVGFNFLGLTAQRARHASPLQFPRSTGHL